MKNLNKESLSQLPKMNPELKPSKLQPLTIQKPQFESQVRKSDGFNTFNQSTTTVNKQATTIGFHKMNQNKHTQSIDFLNNANIKFISNNDPIEIMPSEIIFKDIQTNQTYEISVYIRNLTKKVRRIRVFQPQTAKFRADYDMLGAIAAGLAMKLLVTFETSVVEKGGFHDTMKIVSDDGYEREIPLHAYPQQASIIFEPFLNFGFVKMGKSKTEQIYFKNEGKQPSKVVLKIAEQNDLVMDPAQFTINAGMEYTVNITYTPKEAGIFRGLVEVDTEGQTLLKQIDINATSVEFAKFIIDENGSKAEQLDFGTFFFGQQKSLQCYLVNNTPKKYKFNTRFRFGLIYNLEDMKSLQTPQDVGKELTEKIMSCFPNEGYIDSYSQIPITISCHSQVSYKHQIATQNYSISKEDHINSDVTDYTYSAVFEFNNEKDDPLILHVLGRGMCPQIKLNPGNQLQFGDCAVNDHKEIQFEIKNTNRENYIDVNIPIIPYFHIEPKKAVIQPNEFASFIASYQPKQTGYENSVLNIQIVNNSYAIPLKLQGRCREINKKLPKIRGPECLPENFEVEKVYVNEENLYKKKSVIPLDQSNIESLAGRQSMQYKTKQSNPPVWVNKSQDEQIIKNYEEKMKANEFLNEERLKRVKKEKEKLIQNKYNQMNERLKSMGKLNLGVKVAGNESDDDTTAPDIAPRDYEFEVGMINTRLQTPTLKLLETKDNLYVEKPIGKYETYKNEDNVAIVKFDPKADHIIKKKFPSEPRNHQEIRDIQLTLSGEQLQRIQAGPTFIDFGNVFIRSKMTKTFSIRNDLRNTIQAQLFFTADDFKQSYQKPQIIPPNQVAGFEIVIFSSQLHTIKQNIKYIVNGKHSFEFQVAAKVEYVQVELSRSNMKMGFQEDNIEMFCAENLRIDNKGNGPAKFKWNHTTQRIFTVKPEEGEVPPYSYIDFEVIYRPLPSPGVIIATSQSILGQTQAQNQGDKSQPTTGSQQQVPVNANRAAEEEKLTLKVVDGNEIILKCSGSVSEPKVALKHGNLDLQEIAICKQETIEFSLKNNSKAPAVFQIESESLPECVEVSPNKGKIGADESRQLELKFCCKSEKEIKGDVTILIRGGKTIKIPFYAKTIIPQIQIVEPNFDFGNITTLGNAGILKMTLINNSLIPAQLILDLRSEEQNPEAPDGIECLDIILDQDNEESILHSIHQEAENNEQQELEQQQQQQQQQKIGNKIKINNKDNKEEIDLEDNALNESEQSEDIYIEQKKSNLYTFTMKPNQTLNFTVKFSPKEVKNYKFLVPITLDKFGYLDSIKRDIICRGLKPKFLIEEQIVDFKRKIITSLDKCVPTVKEISLSNPDRKPIKWWLDTLVLNSDKVFNITPTEGVVQPGYTEIIKATFNPFAPENFERSVPIYIDDPEISQKQQYADIVLKGEGQFPRILFDRKEIILPVVPLNIEARCLFRVINDGFENLNIKYRIIQDISNINVDLKFLEGKNLGITKNKLKIEAFFSSNKPISFTTKIEFYDDSGRIYCLPISGTTDNSLFTNFSYFQRTQGEFKLKFEEKDDGSKGAVILIEGDDDDVNSLDGVGSEGKPKKKGAPSVISNKTGSHSSGKSAKSALGYNPISQKFLEENCEFVKRWLTFNVLQNSIQTFPGSVIENNGSEIFELITYLTGKGNFPYKINFDGITKRIDKSQKLFKQYDELLRNLKIEGGMLNHIRPEFLLSYNDYLVYVKTLPQEIQDIMYQNAKLNLQRFTYISIDSWTTLFYQILKIYYLSRINAKQYKQIPGIPADKNSLPSYLEQSNVYNVNECILIHWIEQIYEQKHQLQYKRLLNFDNDFKDGIVVSALIERYAGNVRDLDEMKGSCNVDSDYELNAEKLIKSLRSIQLQTHLKKQDICSPSAREMMLFCIQLLHALPHYIPKPQPIIFACTLGEEVVKNIELNNPTNKSISYWVQLEAVSDFILESEENFTIEPKTTYKARVKFVSRISEPVFGKITFTNKKESNIQAAALVFHLESNITGRISIFQTQMNTCLYEKYFQDIQIKNPFTVDGDFQVTVLCEKFKQTDDKGAPKKVSKKKMKKTQEKPEEVFPQFFCLKEYIKIRKNQAQNLTIYYLPLVLEQQRCFLIFKDKNSGEFQYEILGTIEEPKAIIDNQVFPKGNQIIYVDEPTQLDFPISLNNELITRARNEIQNFIIEKHREKQRYNKNLNLQQPDKINWPGYKQEQIVFDVELQPPNSAVQVQHQFTLYNKTLIQQKKQEKADLQSKDGDQSKKGVESKLDKSLDQKDQQKMELSSQAVDNSSNKFPIAVSFKQPFSGKFLLIFRNSLKTDYRKIEVKISAYPKPVKALLEFRVPARTSSIQKIPILNNSAKDWNIKVNLNGDASKNWNYFSCQNNIKEFIVKKNTQGDFELTFSPKQQCAAQATLILSNPVTNDKFEYELKGYGEEPVAEDHIVINCKARETTQYDIEILNPFKDRDINYKVDTDLINASGPKILLIKAGKKAKYPLKVSPVLSGQYTGSITFYETEESYVWFTVLLNTESPRPSDTIELSTTIRQAIVFDIELSNPLTEPATFEVIINGEGLVGESQFYIQAQTTSIYELIFSPLFTGKGQGSIAFINEVLGEIWYDLKLISEEAPQIRLPVLRTELGKVESHKVVLENPTDKDVKVQTKIVNQTNFDVLPEQIVIKAYDRALVNIRYMPSNLDLTENGEIIFFSQELGKWRYLVFGIGIPPTKFPERVVSVGLNKDFSSTIHFKNPFKEVINITIHMETDEDSKEVFKLLTKSKKNDSKSVLTVPGMNIVQIPFSFVPREINCYYCELVISMNEKIEWRYPVKGVTESISNQVSYNFKTECRQKLEQDIKIFLPGMVNISDSKDEFSYELEIPADYDNIVRSCFKIKSVKKTLDYAGEPLEYSIIFEPNKPFKTSVDFNILRQAGGRWKFKMILEGLPPKEDDLITISSPLNRTTSVSFKLTNYKKQYASFTAQFTADSDAEFSVMPKSGELERLGTEGTTFVISFTPIEYGKTRKGKLIIQTEEMFWSYLIKGILPKYEPPVAFESLISNKLDKQITMIMNSNQKQSSKNFLIENIKRQKRSPPRVRNLNNESQQQQLQKEDDEQSNLKQLENSVSQQQQQKKI